MYKKYEHGGRIGDESFNVGNLGKGNTSGDSLRTLMSRNSKIKVSTRQPKWALNNGPMINRNSLKYLNKYKALTGGKLKKYQIGGDDKNLEKLLPKSQAVVDNTSTMVRNNPTQTRLSPPSQKVQTGNEFVEDLTKIDNDYSYMYGSSKKADTYEKRYVSDEIGKEHNLNKDDKGYYSKNYHTLPNESQKALQSSAGLNPQDYIVDPNLGVVKTNNQNVEKINPDKFQATVNVLTIGKADNLPFTTGEVTMSTPDKNLPGYTRPGIKMIDNNTDIYGKGRAYYNPDDKTMYISDIDDVSHELPHDLQFREDTGIPADRLLDNQNNVINDYQSKTGVSYEDARDRVAYNMPGTLEHNAHKEIQPIIEKKVSDQMFNDQNKMSNDYKSFSKIEQNDIYNPKVTNNPKSVFKSASPVDNSINNSNLQSKPKPGQSVEMKKLGGQLKKYQVAGQTTISNLNNTMRGRGNAGFNPLTGKPNISNNFSLNPNISYGNPKGWGQIYGNADIINTPIFNQKTFAAGYNKKNLGNIGLIYKDINDDRSFGTNVNINRGPIRAVGTADVNKDRTTIGAGVGYNSPLLHGDVNYTYSRYNNKPGGLHGLGAAVGNDRFSVLGNTSIDKANPANNSTNISGVYNGPKGGYVRGGFYKNQQGRSGDIEGGFKGKNGNISGNVSYGNEFNNTNINGEYGNTYNTRKGNKLTVGVKGSMNVGKYRSGGETKKEMQPTSSPETGGYSSPTIPNNTYYATPQSTDTNLKQNNRVNSMALAKKRFNDIVAASQGTVRQGSYFQSPLTHSEAVNNRIANTDLAASTLHIPQYAMTESYNHFINKQPFNWSHLKPGAHGIKPSDLMHLENPYAKFAVDTIFDPLNFTPGALAHTIGGLRNIRNIGKVVEGTNLAAKTARAAIEATAKVAKGFGKDMLHMAEHTATHPIHGPSTGLRGYEYATEDKKKKIASGDVGMKLHRIGGKVRRRTF